MNVNEPELMACAVCIEENKRKIAEHGGTYSVPTLVYGAPEDQQCEHLAEYVRGLTPMLPVATRASLAAFLTTLTPPDPAKKYGVEVEDAKGRTWWVVAHPPAEERKVVTL